MATKKSNALANEKNKGKIRTTDTDRQDEEEPQKL